MYISEWEWSDEIVEHLARHGVSPSVVLDVWRQEPKYRANRKNRAATHQMIGPNSGRRFFTIFIREDDVHEGRWRAVTARRATDAERAWWERS